MKSTIFGLSLVGWLVSASLVATIAIGMSPGDLFGRAAERIPATSAGARGESASAFTADRALALAQSIEDQRLVDGIGTERIVDSIVIPGQRIDGRPLRLAELKLTEFRLAKQVDSIETSGGTLHQFPTKVDVWIAVWERIGVAVPEWGIEDGVIRATVVFEDGTGRILSTSEVKYNPRGGR